MLNSTCSPSLFQNLVPALSFEVTSTCPTFYLLGWSCYTWFPAFARSLLGIFRKFCLNKLTGPLPWTIYLPIWRGGRVYRSTLEALCLYSGTLLDLLVKGHNLQNSWRLVCEMQCFFWECLNMDDGSWSCVKVLYSTCDSVLSAKWLIQIGTQVLKWSRLSPNFVHVHCTGWFFSTGIPLNLLSVGR